ncbi:hypothetical protein [Kriegella aquimaris]|uniref:Glycosyl hydrolase family 32 N-terminal domain-containing protein n=1 Tax=Kriegella aquimaris TaxID=192904 RepID=A0A1G9RYL2_9FLAO|nr:hypothetical protein [Kriegella aquimaris]SDM28321.1 hypothetical protein SAMN04488514_10732 [Kriegella aquimaris]
MISKHLCRLILLVCFTAFKTSYSQEVIDIGLQRELFVDHHLVDSINGLAFKLNKPQEVQSTNIPNGYYQTIIKTDSLYRIYFRDILAFYKGEGYDGNLGEITKSAISNDGYNWQEEPTGLNDSITNYISYDPPFNHNFTPFKDTNPNATHQYKALSGTRASGGLYYFYSDDGITFEKYQEAPIIKNNPEYYAFDSQNVAFWSEFENQYVCYFRRSINGLRSFARTTSPDFIHWSEPVNIFPNLPGEHLYTSGTQPYFRAPHLYIALATRFFPDRSNSTDIVFMNSRNGLTFNRTFKEAFIRPGLMPERWGNRSNNVTLNVVPLDTMYMGIFARNSLYKIRMDGFASVSSNFEEGFFITKPLRLKGNNLEINYSTTAGGYVFIEILDAANNPIPNVTDAISEKLIGDEISRTVTWKNLADLSSLKGRTIKLKITLKEADLYALKFNE